MYKVSNIINRSHVYVYNFFKKSCPTSTFEDIIASLCFQALQVHLSPFFQVPFKVPAEALCPLQTVPGFEWRAVHTKDQAKLLQPGLLVQQHLWEQRVLPLVQPKISRTGLQETGPEIQRLGNISEVMKELQQSIEELTQNLKSIHGQISSLDFEEIGSG